MSTILGFFLYFGSSFSGSVLSSLAFFHLSQYFLSNKLFCLLWIFSNTCNILFLYFCNKSFFSSSSKFSKLFFNCLFFLIFSKTSLVGSKDEFSLHKSKACLSNFLSLFFLLFVLGLFELLRREILFDLVSFFGWFFAFSFHLSKYFFKLLLSSFFIVSPKFLFFLRSFRYFFNLSIISLCSHFSRHLSKAFFFFAFSTNLSFIFPLSTISFHLSK